MKKKELEMRDIEDLLQALAVYMYMNSEENDDEIEEISPGLQRIDALTLLAKVKIALGYNTDTKRFLDVAIGMNILREENGVVEFINRETLDYFVFEGLENGVDKVI